MNIMQWHQTEQQRIRNHFNSEPKGATQEKLILNALNKRPMKRYELADEIDVLPMQVVEAVRVMLKSGKIHKIKISSGEILLAPKHQKVIAGESQQAVINLLKTRAMSTREMSEKLNVKLAVVTQAVRFLRASSHVELKETQRCPKNNREIQLWGLTDIKHLLLEDLMK